MKKITSKQAMTYAVLLGALLLVAVYFLVYKKYEDKATQIEASNVTLNARVTELKQYYDKMDDYKTETEAVKSEILAVLNIFPADVREEDIIVLALDTVKNTAIDYSNINIGDKEALKSIDSATVTSAGMEELTQELVFVERKGTYVNTTVYQDLKECIETINNSDNRLSINRVSYSGNEDTGRLSGTIEVSFYSILGTGKEYVPQDLKDYISGLSELFGTAKVTETEE